MHEVLNDLLHRRVLSREESRQLFLRLTEAEADPRIVAALLAVLHLRGETAEELSGAAEALLQQAQPIEGLQGDLLDTCGTGGDGAQTVNLSTASAIIAAAAGCKVVKHGNRAASSKSGSADVLECLGLPLTMASEDIAGVLERTGIVFLFAPSFHRAVAHVMPVRRALKVRTIFNLLGPLVNPARPTHQLVGVYGPTWTRPMAQALGALGLQRALVVHGSGVDELAIHGKTEGWFWTAGSLIPFSVTPEEVGLHSFPLESLRGGSVEDNAQWLLRLLKGQADEATESAVALNAGAALWVAEKADSLKEGVMQARSLIQSGAGFTVLEQWRNAHVAPNH
jgi:anthranilate phosphoribosyltransferase